MGREYYSSGIDGLDTLLKNGFYIDKGSSFVLLIKGQPGTGKSTLALKILSAASQWEIGEGKVQYYTCEQKKKEIKEKCETFKTVIGFDIISSLDDAVSKPESLEIPFSRNSNALEWANTVAIRISEEETKCKVIAIDGLNLLGRKDRNNYDLENIISLLRQKSIFSIIIYEPQKDEESIIDSIVDMIIEIKGMEYSGPPAYYFNMLSILKSRSQQCVLGWHQYKIKDKGNTYDNGIVVFPSIHHYTSKNNSLGKELNSSLKNFNQIDTELKQMGIYDDFIKSKDNSYLSSILTDIKDNKSLLKSGSCTVILGSRRTCKTLLSLDFLCEGATKNPPESSLIVSLIDNKNTIVKNKICPEYRCKNKCNSEKKCYNNVHLFHYRPGCITSNEFFGYLKKRISLGQITRFAFWDLTQIDFRFPFLSDDKMFLPALMDFVKYENQKRKTISKKDFDRKKLTLKRNLPKKKFTLKRNITSIFMGSLYCKLANSASMMADNVLICLRDTLTLHYENSKATIDGIFVFVDRIEGKPGLRHLVFIELIEDKVFGNMVFLEDVNEAEPCNGGLRKVTPIKKIIDENMSMIKIKENPTVEFKVEYEKIKEIEQRFSKIIEEIEKQVQA